MTRADLVDVADAEVDAAGADGFREAVVRVVLVAREDAAPSRYEARRHGLRADVHEPPLRQLVVFEVDSAVVYRVEDVLHPRHEQPYDGAFFVGYGLDYRLGVRTLEQYAFAARYEAAEPVHLRAGVVEYAEEDVVVRLPVVCLLDLRGVHERAVRVEYRLREACGA